MIDINKEAKEKYPFYVYDGCEQSAFIAGTNSKYVQQKVLQAKITLCEEAIFFKQNKNETSDYLEILLKRFKQQLKQLKE
jgi:hypothetical protein